MAGIPARTFDEFVSSMVTSWGSSIGIVPSFQSGSVLLAVFQAVASQDLFLQAQAQLVNEVARAQTSVGPDLDTFMAQFGFFRLPATFAEGVEQLSLPTPAGVQVIIQPTDPTAAVQTSGGAIQYAIIADTTKAAWNTSLNAYVLDIGATSIDVAIQAITAGSTQNVQAGQLAQFAQPIPGVAFCNNSAPISNGIDEESDDAFRARFVQWLNSLSKATESAILSAIAAVRQGLNLNLLENQNQSGDTVLGEFTVVVDDGSGNPPSSLLTAVFNAVNAVRAFTVRVIVIGPTPVVPTIALNVRVAPGYNQTAVQQAVQQAVLDMADSLQIGQELFISSIESTAVSVPGCLACQPGETKINGEAADLVVTGVQVVQTILDHITVGNYA